MSQLLRAKYVLPATVVHQADILDVIRTADMSALVIRDAPYTFNVFTDRRIWKPYISDPAMFGLTLAAAKATIIGKAPAYGTLAYNVCGLISRGKFYPDMTTGLLDITVKSTGYKTAGGITDTRWCRTYVVLTAEYNVVSTVGLGLSYGSKLAAPDFESADSISHSYYATASNPAVQINIGKHAYLPDNSTLDYRLKCSFQGAGGGAALFYQYTFGEINVNAGEHVYGGAMANSSTRYIQNPLNGLQLIIGAYSNVGSATFQTEYTEVTLNSGYYIP